MKRDVRLRLALLGGLLFAVPLLAQDSLAVKLAELRERYENGSAESKEFKIEEEEANDFLKTQNGEAFGEGIESPWVRFEESLTIAGATVDLEKVREKLPESTLLSLLSGRVPVEVTARLRGEKGVGELELERVLLAGVELPLTLVEMLTSDVKDVPFLPQGFRLGEPFPLPYDVESVRVDPGAVTLQQRPTVRGK